MSQTRDRRVLYKERHRAIGLCEKCRTSSMPGHPLCFRHWAIYKIGKVHMKSSQIPERKRVVREHLIAALWARYWAVKNNVLCPASELDRMKEATDIRLRIGMGWGGVMGVRKLATLIKSIDRKAMKHRNGGVNGSDES